MEVVSELVLRLFDRRHPFFNILTGLWSGCLTGPVICLTGPVIGSAVSAAWALERMFNWASYVGAQSSPMWRDCEDVSDPFFWRRTKRRRTRSFF